MDPEGIEPSFHDCQPCVLPLNEGPFNFTIISFSAKISLTYKLKGAQPMIRPLNALEKKFLTATNQGYSDRSLISTLRKTPVLINGMVCAEYCTEHLHESDLFRWNTTVLIKGFGDVSQLELLISIYQTTHQFESVLGWKRYWTYVWFDPVFRFPFSLVIGHL